MSKRKNLLFLMTDHQRADSLGMRQAGREVTPHLNRLAAESVDFRRTYNACPLCVPARTALATGLFPTRSGVVYNDWRGDTATDQSTLHETLSRAGYDVAHVGVDHIRVKPGLRERIDFALWNSDKEHAAYLRDNGIEKESGSDLDPFRRRITEVIDGEEVERKYSNALTAEWPHAAEHFKDIYWGRVAENFIREERERPFALFVYLWAPHPPLRVPKPYYGMFPPEEITLPPNVGKAPELEPPGRRRGTAAQLAADVTMEQWRRAWSAHLGLVNLADAALGGVLSALRESGLQDDTITFFTADHGDHLGQHAMYQKMEMYDPAVRVPMLIRNPGIPPATEDGVVSHLDVLPTLCDALDLPKPDALDGRSLWPAISAGESPEPAPAFIQYSGNFGYSMRRRAIIDGDWKYVYDPDDAPELYNIKADPLEMANLAADPSQAGRLKRMRETMAAWMTARGDDTDFTSFTRMKT